MFAISMKKLRKQRSYIHHKNIKMNNGNEKHPKKIKVKLRYDLLWSKFAQKFQQTIQRLLNVPIVARY